jgi:ketosteroid isomerase-like protein
MATLDAPLSHAELAAMLAEDERMALSFRDSTLADEQAVAIDYYEARPFGDEEEGLSQVVTPEVAEVVDYMTISVSRTIVAGDRVVEFESAEADSEAAAEEATAAVTYCFLKQQDGYRVIHDWIQSG